MAVAGIHFGNTNCSVAVCKVFLTINLCLKDNLFTDYHCISLRSRVPRNQNLPEKMLQKSDTFIGPKNSFACCSHTLTYPFLHPQTYKMVTSCKQN